MSNIGGGFKPKAPAARLAPGAVACKCQICNCGSHKCPPDQHLYQLTPAEAEQFQSSYMSNFTAHPVGARSRGGPRSDSGGIFPHAPFSGQTTCQSDFTKPDASASRAALQRPRPAGDPGLINGGSQERSFSSETRGQFSPKGNAKRESYAPQGAKHTTNMPFEGQSTTQQDFHAHSGAKPSTPFREQPTRSDAKEDRDFQSEAALKFVQHSDQRRKGFAPPPRNSEHSVPFEGVSTTKQDYPAWQSAGPARSCAPQQSHAAANETRDFKSSNAMAFDAKGYNVRESFKPRGASQALVQSGPFSGVSTSASSYTGAQGDKASSARPRGGLTDTIGVALGSKDDRVWVSENRGQFDPKGQAKRESYAPQGAKHTTGMKFEGTSTTQQDFHGHQGAKPSTPFREKPTRSDAKEDRDFQSESQLKFVAHPDARRKGFAPAPRSSEHNVPFEGVSTTRADYPGWKPQGCPANQLPDNGARGQDGHTLYKQVQGGQWAPFQQ